MSIENESLEELDEAEKILINIAQKHEWTVTYEDDIYLSKIVEFGDGTNITIQLQARALKYESGLLKCIIYNISVKDNRYNKISLSMNWDVYVETKDMVLSFASYYDSVEEPHYFVVETKEPEEFKKQLESIFGDINGLIKDIIELAKDEINKRAKWVTDKFDWWFWNL